MPQLKYCGKRLALEIHHRFIKSFTVLTKLTSHITNVLHNRIMVVRCCVNISIRLDVVVKEAPMRVKMARKEHPLYSPETTALLQRHPFPFLSIILYAIYYELIYQQWTNFLNFYQAKQNCRQATTEGRRKEAISPPPSKD